MKYNAIPATFLSIESGHLCGPGTKDHVSVETESISEIANNTDDDGENRQEDSTRNVVVLTFDNLVRKAKNEPSLEPLALKFDDCRILCRDLLIHLACGGDDIAKFLCQHLAHNVESDSDDSDDDDSYDE